MELEGPTDHSNLLVLPTAECLARLTASAIGRVGFVSDGEVLVLPVHHVVRGAEVYFRTGGGSKIEAAADRAPMGFEVDDHDATSGTGWSVTVVGTASVVDDDGVVGELEELRGPGWIVGDPAAQVWVRIRTHAMSGRELLAP